MEKIVLPEGGEFWLRDHLAVIEKKIREEAKKIAEVENREGAIEPCDVSEAAKRYTQTTPIKGQDGSPPRGVWSRIGESISGITLVSALLAIIFGALGLFPFGGAQGAGGAQGWLDIAKIFAGAVVGSAGATVTVAARGK